MSATPDEDVTPGREPAGYTVDAREASGVQIGERNTQIVYTYPPHTGRPAGSDLAPPPLAAVSGCFDSPYRGLNAFGEGDAAFFFGRETTAGDILRRLSRRPASPGITVVSGVSGAGKSSLVRAGVLPRIRGAGLPGAPEAATWPCLLLTPTRAPLDELALGTAALAGLDAATVRRALADDPAGFALTARQAALAAPGAGPDGNGRRLLIVVDQFEQLFTLCRRDRERRGFIAALHAAAVPEADPAPGPGPAAVVLLVVRADFEARCADHPDLITAVQDRYLVTAMTERQLRMAVTGPARRAGAVVQDELTETLLREISTRRPGCSSPAPEALYGAGVLPLLSHALDQAWRHRLDPAAVTLADYERTGGIEGAVAASAQHAYERLTPAQQRTARQVFTRLAAAGDGGVDTADRVARADLTQGDAADGSDVAVVLESFAAERLLTLAAGTVEITHEVLLSAWPLLRDVWLAESRADRTIRTRLRDAAAEWDRNSRDSSYLYGGSLLETTAEAAARIGADPDRHTPLGRTERAFLRAGDRARRRRVRRRRAVTGFLLALTVALTAAAGVALRTSRDAVRQRDVAVAGQLVNHSQTVADTDPALAALESVAAWRLDPSAETRYAMRSTAARPGIAALAGHGRSVTSVAFSPDGKTLATGSHDETVVLWDVATRRQTASLAGHSGSVTSVAFSPDGRTLAVGGYPRTVRLWNVATRRQIGVDLPGHTGSVASVVFSPDGRTLATSGADKSVRLWDVATRRLIAAPLRGHSERVVSTAFSPDGKTLAVGGDNTVWLWDVRTRRRIATFDGYTSGGGPLAFSLDGRRLVTGAAQLWDAVTRRRIGGPLDGHTGRVNSVAFSPDGVTLATGGDDGTVRLWDVVTRKQIGASYTGHTRPVTSVAFNHDGSILAGGGHDHSVRLWEVIRHRQIGSPLVGHTDGIISMAFSPDGATLASGGFDTRVWLWDVAGRRRIAPLAGHTTPVTSVAFSPDGKTLASCGGDGTVRLWETASRRQIGAPLTGHPIGLTLAAFSPDGRTLATAGDRALYLWNAGTHRRIARLDGHASLITSVVFSPDRRVLATGGTDGTVVLWEVARHRRIGVLRTGHTDGITSMAFGPDGSMLAVGGDRTLSLWLVPERRQVGSPITGHTDNVVSVSFGPDGTTLASGGLDRTVRLWDVATRRQVGAPLTGHTGPVTSVAFSPDRRTLASGGGDQTVRLRDVTAVSDVPHRLCARAGRPFTPADWARHIPPGPEYRPLCP
ncbi:hypothetical protein [Rhizohabitans arisaemae]|uniref:nSTAND1 domain-containing NTPase n=1 Tax=Rhizohabitans arisaemae TaxID=2720610 RepID=UPI0024B061F5|nr:hypothetical protein [Rhizohabitans arisaemae]